MVAIPIMAAIPVTIVAVIVAVVVPVAVPIAISVEVIAIIASRVSPTAGNPIAVRVVAGDP
jgi:hypothetical protein